MKTLINRWFGITLIKPIDNPCWKWKLDNFIPKTVVFEYSTIKYFLKDYHKIKVKWEFEMTVKLNHKLEYKLVWFKSEYKYEFYEYVTPNGTSYKLPLCQRELKKIFGHIPKQMSYDITRTL